MLMLGALRGRISPCCFLTGHPFAGAIKKENKQEMSQEESRKEGKILFSSVTYELQVKKHPVKCWSLGCQLFLEVEGWINALLSMVMTSQHMEINTLFLWRCNMDAWKEILFLLRKSELLWTDPHQCSLLLLRTIQDFPLTKHLICWHEMDSY